MRKNVKWVWEKEQAHSFVSLARATADTASLRLPDLNKPFVLQTDASDYSVGAVLLQKHESELLPVAFTSRTPTPAERNYSVTEKECLAIMFLLSKLDMYLDGAVFTVQTDIQALTWLKGLKNPAGRLARWALTLQRYAYTIEYRRGSTNKVADALPRALLGAGASSPGGCGGSAQAAVVEGSSARLPEGERRQDAKSPPGKGAERCHLAAVVSRPPNTQVERNLSWGKS